MCAFSYGPFGLKLGLLQNQLICIVNLACPVAKALGILFTEKQFPEVTELPDNFVRLHPNECLTFRDTHSEKE